MLAGLAMQNICRWLSPHLTSYTQHITRLRSYPIPLGLPEHKPPAGSPVQTVAVERPKAQSQKHQKNSNLKIGRASCREREESDEDAGRVSTRDGGCTAGWE